ncbi:MAG: DNA polymerase III subunit delta [Anaerolineae bacterium]|nr:MAG: DNA polymerase III subunit delta [Anaerolineae bacterium]
MAKPTPTFYILHGEDEYSRKGQLVAMRRAMNDPNELNTTILSGADVSPMAVINAVSVIPFLADKRLVIVEGLLARLDKGKSGKEELEKLCESLIALPEFARLVFHENTTLSKNNPVLKLAQENPNGYEKTFVAPANLTQWIMAHTKNEFGADIEPNAAAALASVVDKDLRAADSEIAKIVAYVNYERPINEIDVATLTPYIAEANIFEMVDAIGRQDGKTALTIARQLLNEGSEPLSLFGMINRQFRLLILAREYIDEYGSTDGMAKVIGVHDFVAKKLGGQARQFAALELLEDIYRKLVDYDFQIKTGKMSDQMALEVFIAGVTK